MPDDKDPPHPMQPVILDPHSVARFKANAIVVHLLDHGRFDMNVLALLPFSREDWEQFAQLIGYSVSGAADLSYVSDELFQRADAEVAALLHGRQGPEAPAASPARTAWERLSDSE